MCSLLESEHWELTVLKHLNIIKLKFDCIGIRAFIIVAVAGHENVQYFNSCAVALPSFTLDSFGRSIIATV